MAIAPDSAATDLTHADFDAASLVRTASWGIGAAGALFVAVLAGLSDSGAPRVAVAVAILSGTPEKAVASAPKTAPVPTAPQPQTPPQPTLETRRLVEQVRLLAADRDRLVQRVGTIERNLEDVTGSIRRREAAAQTPSPAEPPPPQPAASAAPVTVATAPWPVLPPEPATRSPWGDPASQPTEPAPDVTSALPPATPLPPPRPGIAEAAEAAPAPEAPAAKPEAPRQASLAPRQEHPPSRPAYGVDLGGAASVDRLRMLWNALRTNEAKLLQGLRPVTHIREVRRGGRPDVRLIAGPLASADDATRLCGAILNAGRYCEPAMFLGNRLPLR